MTITYGNRYDVQTRVRRRRRKITEIRHKCVSRKIKSICVIVTICASMTLFGYIGAQDNGYMNSGLSSGAFAAEETVYKKVIVYKGDTIWGIASEYTEPSKDIRKNIKVICEINNVEPGKIYPGQVLLVPVPASLA